jgi:peptide/nickel transport system permease protein
MLSVLRQDYIRTAFAKGLEPGKVYWKHAFRNSLIPIITMFSSFLPAMISGAVIVEYLFSIPGMGRVSYESVLARNFPVQFTILMFSALLTMAGTLLSDILYVVTDPRISFTKKEG